MTTSQNSLTSFPNISNIYLKFDEGRFQLLTQSDHRNKQLKQSLSHVLSILKPLSEINQADNPFIRSQLPILRDFCSRIMTEVDRLAPLEENSSLVGRVKNLNNSINLELTMTALSQIKSSFILALKIYTHEKTLQQTKQSLEDYKKDLSPKFQEANKLYQKVLEYCQDLIFKIDNLKKRPKPSKEIEDTIVYRSNGALTETFVAELFKNSETEEIDSVNKFNDLIQEWNTLSYKLTEIKWHTKALDIINAPVTSLAETRKKLEIVESQISTIKKTTQIYEQCLADKLDPEVNLSIILPKVKPTYEEVEASLRNIIENMGRQNLIIQKSLDELKTPANKTFDSKNFDPEIRARFVETNEKVNLLFNHLEKEISISFESLKSSLKKAELELNLLKETSEFINDLASIAFFIHKFTKTLRDTRKEAITNKYEAAHSNAKTHWVTICSEIHRLSKSHSAFTQKMIHLNKLEDDGEQKEPNDDIVVLLPGETAIISAYLERLTKLTKIVNECWDTNLREVCTKAALELNLGVEALASKHKFPQNLAEAFPTKLGYKVTTVMRGSFSESPPIPYYQSPFETLGYID